MFLTGGDFASLSAVLCHPVTTACSAPGPPCQTLWEARAGCCWVWGLARGPTPLSTTRHRGDGTASQLVPCPQAAPAPEGSDVLSALLPKCHHYAAGGQPQPSPLAGVLRGARGDGATLDGNEPQGGITE